MPPRNAFRVHNQKNLLDLLLQDREREAWKMKRYTRSIWKRPDCYWTITRVEHKPAKEGTEDLHRGKVWGVLTWRGVPETRERKVRGLNKREWHTYDPSFYERFQDPERYIQNQHLPGGVEPLPIFQVDKTKFPFVESRYSVFWPQVELPQAEYEHRLPFSQDVLRAKWEETHPPKPPPVIPEEIKVESDAQRQLRIRKELADENASQLETKKKLRAEYIRRINEEYEKARLAFRQQPLDVAPESADHAFIHQDEVELFFPDSDPEYVEPSKLKAFEGKIRKTPKKPSSNATNPTEGKKEEK